MSKHAILFFCIVASLSVVQVNSLEEFTYTECLGPVCSVLTTADSDVMPYYCSTRIPYCKDKLTTYHEEFVEYHNAQMRTLKAELLEAKTLLAETTKTSKDRYYKLYKMEQDLANEKFLTSALHDMVTELKQKNNN